MDVKTRARKILGPMQSYYSADSSDLSGEASNTHFSEGEECLGLYKNGEGDFLLITDIGIHVCREGKTVFAAYKDIRKIVPSRADKLDTDLLAVNLNNGNSVLIPVKHGNGKFKDIYEFERFLNRVSSC